MRTWVTVTLAAVAAVLLIVAAALLIVQEDTNGPEPADELPDVPDEEPEEDEPGRPLETEAGIEVTEAWIDEGDCIVTAEEENEPGSGSDGNEDPEQTEQTDGGQAPTDGSEAQQDPEEGPEEGPEEDPPGDAREACHRIRVTVTAHADRPFIVGVGLWEAEDTRAQMHNASWVRSPDPLDAGGTRSVVVSFDASDDIRLLQLRYDDPDGPTLSSPVGPYENDATQEEVVEAR